MRQILYLIPIVVFAAIAAIAAWELINPGYNPEAIPSPLVNKPAPAFRLPRLDGDGTLSQADLAKGVVVFNVFSSWCLPCRAEHPILTAIAREPKVRLIGLNYKDTPGDVRHWLTRLGNPYKAIAEDRHGRVAIDWGVYGVPETFILKDGRIRYKQVGPITPGQYEDTIRPMIERLIR